MPSILDGGSQRLEHFRIRASRPSRVSSERRRSVVVATIAGTVAIVTALLVVLSRSPLVVGGTNSIAPAGVVGSTKGPAQACQGGETVPRGTTAVRMWTQSNVKPHMRVAVLAGSRTVASGSQRGGWLGKVTTVPVTPIEHTLRNAHVCFSIDRAVQAVNLLGGPSSHPEPGEQPNKMRIEYLRPSSGSWWSGIGTVAHKLGIGRAPEDGWAVALPLIMMGLATALVVATILRRLGRVPLEPAPRTQGFGRDEPRDRRPQTSAPPLGGARRAPPPIAGAQTTAPGETPARRGSLPPTGTPRPTGTLRQLPRRLTRAALRLAPATAWVCAAVAFLSAASWSILTPPFQAPDEPSHFAYVQILAETGALPKLDTSLDSPEESAVLEDLDMRTVRYNPAIETISSAAQQQRLRRDLARPLSRIGQGAGVATSEPPLFYALQTLPYLLGSGGSLLDRLELMRLLSALLAACAALFGYLFLREALPRVPWAWTVGGLCMALAPLVGFMSGVVNPDAMLCAVSAALFYCLACAFRRGLTLRLAIAIGAVTACGLLTKLNFVGLVPGVMLALALLARRVTPALGRRAALRLFAVALGAALLPACVYVLALLAANDNAALAAFSNGVSGTRSHPGSLLDELSYIWQFYLPPLPGMTHYFPGISTPLQVWFDKSVGLYGWLDTTFPNWVYDAALLPAGAIAALCLRELLRLRPAVRARAAELGAYAVMGVGLLGLFGADSYTESVLYTGAFSEPRYLLPLAVLFAAVLALAARGAGRRWGPAAGALIVLLILAHDIFSQLLLVGRYYG